jgi:hypothetical protein
VDLPFFKKTSSSPQREYFFALEIDHSVVKSAIWSVINDKSQVLTLGSNVAWDDQSEESLIAACDQTLSDAAVRLDPTGKVQPEKVILGLPPDWMDGDKINSNQLRLLKNLTQKLSLSAAGFVITPEAAARFLQHSEGVPPTVILLGFWPHHLEVTLARLGKIEGVQLVKRSGKPVADVIEGLSRFSHIDMLPSRMLLYDSGLDLEDIKQTLLAHPWQSPQTRLPFLHFPKVETLPSDFTIRAIALSGGTEVARAIGLISSAPEIASPAVSEPELPAALPVPASSVEQLGFVENQDVNQYDQTSKPELEQELEAEPEPVETYIPYSSSPARPRLKLPALSLPRLSLKFSFAPVVILLILVALAGGLFAAYWYLPRATVVLSINPRPLETQFDLTADTTASSVDPSRSIIPARYLEVNASSGETLPTTGSKLVGDKATGSVTLINGTSSVRSFLAGTVIVSPSGLKFVLDSDVQIASASGTADPNSYQPGKANVNVTASQIGTDSNLSAGTQFKVGSFSTLDYVAKNEAAFSGGSSRQAKAVAPADIAKLRADLTNSLRDQAKQQLSGQVGESDTIVPESIQLQTVSETFDRKLDEVADQISLQLTVKAKGLSFVKSDLDSLVSQQLRPLIPGGFDQTGEANQSFIVKKADKNTLLLTAQVSASLMPHLDQSQVVHNIVGKNPAQAQSYLSNLPGVAQISFTFVPRLPTQLLTLPHTSNNIKLVIQQAQ